MRLLGQTIALGDIDDVENFIQQNITRSGVRLTNDQRAELVAEGFAIVLELWTKYDPAKDPGGAPRPDGSTQGVKSFAGYASFLLPRKLGDAYHRMFEHHVRRTTVDEHGRKIKRWVYLDPCLSYQPDAQGGEGCAEGSSRVGTLPRGVVNDHSVRTVGNFIKAGA